MPFTRKCGGFFLLYALEFTPACVKKKNINEAKPSKGIALARPTHWVHRLKGGIPVTTHRFRKAHPLGPPSAWGGAEKRYSQAFSTYTSIRPSDYSVSVEKSKTRFYFVFGACLRDKQSELKAGSPWGSRRIAETVSFQEWSAVPYPLHRAFCYAPWVLAIASVSKGVGKK